MKHVPLHQISVSIQHSVSSLFSKCIVFPSTLVCRTSAIFRATLSGWRNRNLFLPFFVSLNLAGKRSHLITKTWHLYVPSWNRIFIYASVVAWKRGKDPKWRNQIWHFSVQPTELINIEPQFNFSYYWHFLFHSSHRAIGIVYQGLFAFWKRKKCW